MLPAQQSQQGSPYNPNAALTFISSRMGAAAGSACCCGASAASPLALLPSASWAFTCKQPSNRKRISGYEQRCLSRRSFSSACFSLYIGVCRQWQTHYPKPHQNVRTKEKKEALTCTENGVRGSGTPAWHTCRRYSPGTAGVYVHVYCPSRCAAMATGHSCPATPLSRVTSSGSSCSS